MRFTSLPQLEKDFLSTGNNGEYTFRPIAIPVPGEALTMEAQFCTPTQRTGYFHAQESDKERILLHFTAGQIRSDMSALTRQDFHVSVPFVISRNGTIYQLYSSRYWSGNIGKGLGNANNDQDKRTIAIEISNYAYLTEKDGNLETIYSRTADAAGNPGPVDIYCSLTETDAFQKLPQPFRGQLYYASFTNEQYESLIILLRYLTAQYNIPRQFLPEDIRYTTTDKVLDFKGIVSHVNYRDTGKWDIGPAFDWDRLIKAVQAPAQQQPAATANRSLVADTGFIRSEDELIHLQPASKGIINETAAEAYADIDSTVLLEAAAEQPKNLFALIVGIDDYRADIRLERNVSFPKLGGCVKDAQKIKTYLESDTSFTHHIKMLTNAAATKQAVADQFIHHLGQAGKGDTILFYYSGHGAQEWADEEVWTRESDGRLECIACYYDEQTKDNFLLADKELRFLIKKLSDTGAHIVMIFDCCHSGDNTRNAIFTETAFEKAVAKRIPFSFKKRNWEQFIFSPVLSREDVLTKGEAVSLPEGLHVQLAACESDEVAVEVGGEGVFTKALLATLLSSDSNITYQALRSRIRQYLRNVYEQKPRIYVVNGEQNLLYSNFLSRRFAGNSLAFGDVLYNSKTGWQLSLGAIHGIGENIKPIRILDPENSQEAYTGNITTIKTDTSLLQITNGDSLDKGRVYKGYVENLLCSNLRVQLKNTDGNPETQEALVKQLTAPANGFLILDDNNPDYIINNRNGQIYMVRPGDEYRPVAAQIPATPEAAGVIENYLKQISAWEHLKNLVNSQSAGNLAGNEIAVQFRSIKNGVTKDIPAEKNTVQIEYEKTGDRWTTNIEIELTNTTNQSLYCATLYLTSNFGSLNNLLPGMVFYLEPGKKVKLEYKKNPFIPFAVNREILWYNWPQQTEYLKLIVSTDEFDIASLALEGLPAALTPGAALKGLNRGIDENPDTENINRWGTQTITIQQPNPEFNSIQTEKLDAMLKDPTTADFALGLYFDLSVGTDMQPIQELKEEIQVQDITTRNIIGDTVISLANAWARSNRNNRYAATIKKFPDRRRIVSEGDSWFQHPLVLDIIDHLSRTYAVYCVAAAGDTLRNYQSGKKANGEYYLDAIDTIQPTHFLISGGGNDILGSKFQGFLQDNADPSLPESASPERFLRTSVFNEINTLADIYAAMFQQLKDAHPNLKIIVHGYDYPVKLDSAKKGWLGRYMIAKNISRPGDRKAIVHLIMDTFNEKLKAVADRFSNVSYIDVRGLVRYDPANLVDQWYDEIHPNDEGFQQIAMQFMKKISAEDKSQ